MKEIWSDKVHEECGVFGVYRRDENGRGFHHALRAVRAAAPRPGELRHGRERRRRVLQTPKELGLVNEVFTDVLESMPRGNMCIGHCRYATTGTPVRVPTPSPLSSAM